MFDKPIRSALALLLLPVAPAVSNAHPHVFAEARLEVVVDGGTVKSLKHLWRFDELFSSTVLVEFDKNGDLELDEAELATVSKTVLESIAEYDFFQTVTHNGKTVTMAAPQELIIDFQGEQMIILFESSPANALPVMGKLTFGVYDPTFYTAIEYSEDGHMTVAPDASGCKYAVVRPDPDEAIAQNQQTLTDAFFDDPTGNDMSKLFATRLELDCGA